jgi:hypothetical protein
MNRNLTGRPIPIATPDALMLIEHTAGLHTEESEKGCPGCADEVYKLPVKFASTNS